MMQTRFSRRSIVGGLAAGTAVTALTGLAPVVFAQRAADEIPVEKLMEKGPLEDLSYGNPDAKVTVIEYASMTCGHCARFHNDVYPALKEKYIDTNKIRFIMREFPLDNLAAAASMLARCAGTPERSEAMISALFKRQNEWVVRGDPVPKLFDISKQLGFTQESFDKCLTDQNLLTKISQVRGKASEEFGVSATPTFFINGKRLTGATNLIETFEKAIDPLLKSS